MMASGPRYPLSACENQLTSQTKEDEDKMALVANTFVNMMDNYMGWAPDKLHEDAVMDWFGRFLLGRSSIIYFLRSHVSKTRHVIESISKIPPLAHRLVKVKDAKKSRRIKVVPLECNTPSAEECGQGDCKGFTTPDNAVLPNEKELVKAPCVKRPVTGSFDWEKCEFLEIRGKLEFESSEALHGRGGKKLERIVLAYTDQIHLVVYEGVNSCRKKLFS